MTLKITLFFLVFASLALTAYSQNNPPDNKAALPEALNDQDTPNLDPNQAEDQPFAPPASLDNPASIDALSLKVNNPNPASEKNENPLAEYLLSVENITTTWLRLALIGKSQAEIEAYFIEAPPELIQSTKRNLRLTLLNVLKRRLAVTDYRSDHQSYIQAQKIAYNQVSYYGLELDPETRKAILIEFEINL